MYVAVDVAYNQLYNSVTLQTLLHTHSVQCSHGRRSGSQCVDQRSRRLARLLKLLWAAVNTKPCACVCVCVCVVAMPGQCMPATHTQTYVRHRSTAQHCTASPCYISGTPVHHGAAQSQYQQHLSPSTSITRQGRGTGPRPSPSRQQNTKSIRGLYVSSILAALSVTLKRITRANSALVICAMN